VKTVTITLNDAEAKILDQAGELVARGLFGRRWKAWLAKRAALAVAAAVMRQREIPLPMTVDLRFPTPEGMEAPTPPRLDPGQWLSE
jgi:hypothetical protein